METAESEAIFHELARSSWQRFHQSYYEDRVDDVLLGALIASLVGAGYALIGLNSDGENHHLRAERLDEASRLILRLTQGQGSQASVLIGYGEHTSDLPKVWSGFEAEAKSLYSPAWEPGIISFDADLAANYLYAQISLILDLNLYIGTGFHVDLARFGSHIEALKDCLRRYLRGRLGRPSDASPGPHASSGVHQRELKESRHEVLMGEIIAVMAESGYYVIGIATDADCRRIRFRAQQDAVLNAVLIGLESDRFGQSSRQVELMLQGEIKNYLASTDKLLELHQQLQQMPRTPVGEGITLSYRMNSVMARCDRVLAAGDREGLRTLLHTSLSQLSEQLAPYQKSFSPFSARFGQE